jgi:hypothetical protein
VDEVEICEFVYVKSPINIFYIRASAHMRVHVRPQACIKRPTPTAYDHNKNVTIIFKYGKYEYITLIVLVYFKLCTYE